MIFYLLWIGSGKTDVFRNCIFQKQSSNLNLKLILFFVNKISFVLFSCRMLFLLLYFMLYAGCKSYLALPFVVFCLFNLIIKSFDFGSSFKERIFCFYFCSLCALALRSFFYNTQMRISVLEHLEFFSSVGSFKTVEWFDSFRFKCQVSGFIR